MSGDRPARRPDLSASWGAQTPRGAVRRTTLAGAGMPPSGSDDGRDWRAIARKAVRYSVFAFSAMIILGVIGVSITYAYIDVPDPKPETKTQDAKIYWAPVGKSDPEIMATLGSKRTNISLSQVPQHVRDAVLSAEDHTFYDHTGISLRGIARAVRNNASGGEKQGASTITQQYIKNSRLTSERTYTRKVKEILLAVKLEKSVHKDVILEGYLNTIYWGRSSWGIEAASKAYFDKSVSELTVAEGAYLAGIIRSPGLYAPGKPITKDRWNTVLDLMVQHGKLSPQERAKVKYKKPVPYNPTGITPLNGHIVSTVQAELRRKGYSDKEISTEGYHVYTTIRQKDQEAARDAVEKVGPTKNMEGVRAGLASVNPQNGEVIAMYGGKDPLGFNAATQARKQAGSTFKAFTLAAALQDGENLFDRKWAGKGPLVVNEGKPDEKKITNLIEDKNADGDVKIDLMEATRNSVNTAFVDVAQTIGAAKVKEAIEQGGGLTGNKVRDRLQVTPTLTLGTAAVSPMDLATAYAAFANDGKRPEWHVIRRLEGPEGQILFRAATDDRASARAFDVEDARKVAYALKGVVDNGTGRNAKIGGRDVAGKTGTHEGLTAWFVGFTPESATAVNFYREEIGKDGKVKEVPLRNIGDQRGTFTGGNYPAKIFRKFTSDHLEGKPAQSFVPPSDLGRPVEPVDPEDKEKDKEGEGQTPTPEPTLPQPTLPGPSPEPSPEPSPSPTFTLPPDDGGDEEPVRPGRRKTPPPPPGDELPILLP